VEVEIGQVVIFGGCSWRILRVQGEVVLCEATRKMPAALLRVVDTEGRIKWLDHTVADAIIKNRRLQ
jgi:hypothetical protein